MWIFEIFRDMLRDLPEMFKDWPIGTFLAVILSGMLLLVAVFIGAGVFYAADSWFLPRERERGSTVGKEFIPAHTTTTLVSTGKTTVPVTNYHPDRWTVTVRVGDRQDHIDVSREYHNSAEIGKTVVAEFVNGRMSGDMYLRAIY